MLGLLSTHCHDAIKPHTHSVKDGGSYPSLILGWHCACWIIKRAIPVFSSCLHFCFQCSYHFIFDFDFYRLFDILDFILSPSSITTAFTFSSSHAIILFESSVKGVGQFMFADTIVGSCLVLIGIAISSRRGALFAWIGASVGCLTSFYLIALPPSRLLALRTGLYGYNSSGTCASVGGGVFFDVGIGTSLLAIVGAMLSVLLQVAFESFFSHLYGVSILTFPFIVSTWIILVTRASHFIKKKREKRTFKIIRAAILFKAFFV